MPIFLLEDRKLRKMPHWIQSVPPPNHTGTQKLRQASFNTKAKIKHVLLPHVLPHHDQLNKNLDGGAVMWIFLKTPQLILIYSQSWVETYHSIFLSFQGECDQKKRIQVRGGAKVEMGKRDKLIFQEWNFHLVPQHASKVHF